MTLIVMGFVVGGTATAQTEVHEQLWPEADVFIRTSYGTRVFLLAGATRDMLTGPVDAQYGAHFDVGLSPILREMFTSYDDEVSPLQYLFLRGGIRYFTATSDDNDNQEIRGLVELTARDEIFGSVLLAFRNRMELRWINGDFSWRWRSRLWLERTFFLVESVSLTPYVSSELFYDSRSSAFGRLRTMAGLRCSVTEWLAPEVNVGYQRDWELRDSKTYFLSAILNFYF